MKKAVLFGASGFVGSHLLYELLHNPDYEQVTVVVRNSLGVEHPKLKTVTGDFHSLPGVKDALEADDIFIALGTTKKKTPDQAEYYRIDHEYLLLAAKIAKEKGAKSVLLVSAVGADAKSSVFYLRTKGETEQDIIALDFEHTQIFRPSMIMGNRKEDRPLEKVLITIWSVLNPVFIGSLNRYKGMDAKDIAKAMNNAARRGSEKLSIYGWQEMNALLMK